MKPGGQHTPSEILRRINTIGAQRPTQAEWDALVDSTHVAMARTICAYAKKGKRPPELDFFDGEMEDRTDAGSTIITELAKSQKKFWNGAAKQIGIGATA